MFYICCVKLFCEVVNRCHELPREAAGLPVLEMCRSQVESALRDLT